MAARSFIGTWEVICCVSQDCRPEKSGIEGTQFSLDESGDVTWTVSEGAETIPLFSCETYEIYSTSLSGIVMRFGAYAGHVIEFRVEHAESQDVMVLTCEGWCLLHCKKVTEAEPDTPVDSIFSLLPALEDGYFSDLYITAGNNKQFAVHTCVLRLSAPGLDWTHRPPPLAGLPEDVLGTVLHFLYAECLPPGLAEHTARQCMAAVAGLPGLERLARMCELYLKNMALKQQIIGLVSDMHACASQIIEHFTCKTSPGEHSGENLNSNPAKLCFVVKQSVREAAVAGVKLLLLCDLFTKRKSELSREERHEIIRYAKSRLPVFMNQLHGFLQGMKSTFSSMSPSQRQEVATFLVPEIETILDTVSALVVEVKSALEQIITALSPSEGSRIQKGHVSEVLGKSLKHVLHIRELSKLRNFHQRITFSLVHLLQKKDSFNDMTSANKVRSVARNLEQLIEELPIFLLRLEEVTAALDDRLDWREFKFCFKVGTSKVSGALQKLRQHSGTLQDMLAQLCELVQRDAFAQALQSLGLLVDSAAGVGGSSTGGTSGGSTGLLPSPGSGTQSGPGPKQHGYKLNLVESLCIPPTSCNSQISKAAMQLLKSGESTDMVFEVVPSQDTPDCATTLEPCEVASTVRAHRVIVAARCDWFRRALLSGMREAIDRRIVVHDTQPLLFALFLQYLYSGQLRTCDLTVDQLADLLLLSDRYEVDSLKQACERGLKRHIDEDSVLYFLSMGDQFNAKLLRTACLNFISLNPDIMDSELFGELSENLQAEIYDLLIWVKPSKSATAEKLLPFPQCPSPESPASVSSSLADLQEMASGLRIGPSSGLGHEVEASDSSSLEELPLTQDSARLESCLVQLRDIVGEQVSREHLVQIALAADYDINRAANFYYSS